VLFFVSVGMLFDPQHLVREPWLTAATAGIVLLGKPVAGLLIVLALGYGAQIGLRVSVALAQIGEFSFILAVLGTQLGVLPASANDSVVAVSILTIMLNPLLYRAVPSVERALMSVSIRWFRSRQRGAAEDDQAQEARARAVVVGYGPVGETVARLLEQEGVRPIIIELNLDTVRRLKSEGALAVYGDACRSDVLQEAGLGKAIALVLSAPGSPECAEIIRAARQLNPHIQVLARAEFVSGAEALKTAGADEVFSGEAEVAIAMVDATLRNLGATPEQMDRERERVRIDLYGQPGRTLPGGE
jgi:CPA2 family monovalent cation:H+ antiporter-2